MQRRLKPLRSSSISILLKRASDKLAVAITSLQQEEELCDSNYTWVSGTKNNVKLRAAEQISIKPNSMKMELVECKARGNASFKQDEQLAHRAQLIFAKRIMEDLPNRPLYTLLVNSTNTEIHIPKRMVIGQSNILIHLSRPLLRLSTVVAG